MTAALKAIPGLRTIARACRRIVARVSPKGDTFPGSAEYWENRYVANGDSGVGSYGKFAEFKAQVLNQFVSENDVRTVLEFGCGDGNQLRLANYPKYLGFDVSNAAIATCRQLFANDHSKSFESIANYSGETGDLSMSLDVIYHLVEDDVFDQHMEVLFRSSKRFVVIYASDSDDNDGYENTHVRHRHFTRWIQNHAPLWELREHVPNKYPYEGDYLTGTFADFYIYEKSSC
ncbi:MAG: class I SAM-dependent methyltransferase [Acidimicrobiia bacterium]|nr:class I SAM-dependent methyltransferase [Acidimicrobiia bacterium]